MSKDKSFELGTVILTSGIVLLMGLILMVNVYAQNPLGRLHSKTVVQQRSPAGVVSVVGNSLVYNSIKTKISRLELNCLSKSESLNFEVPSEQVQLSGKLCGQGELQDVSVINRSNGAETSAFKIKDQRFLTEYFYLAKGENQIFISLKGESEKSIAVNLKITQKNQKLTE